MMELAEAPDFVTGETGSVARPNPEEILKRVSVVIFKHIAQGERRAARVAKEKDVTAAREYFFI
tara:strand:+ start:602 stop:793 length:192 start_codon:yes stop_codon:yes gene_type:complete